MSSHIPGVQVRHAVIAFAAMLLGISTRSLHLHPHAISGIVLLVVSICLLVLAFIPARAKGKSNNSITLNK